MTANIEKDVTLEGFAINKDVKLSNIKGLLIFLVVFGHLLEVFKTQYYELFLIIYAFHMPLFVFVSGYFAKRVKFSKVVNLLLIYLIFQTMFAAVISIVSMSFNLEINYVVPFFHLWYIISMIAWYCLAMLIIKVKPSFYAKVFIIVLTIGISILSRVYTGDIVNLISNVYPDFYSYTLSYQRTLSFAPYFFLGFFVNQETLSKIYSSLKFSKLIAGFSVPLIMLYFHFLNKEDMENLFRGSYGVEELTSSTFSVYLEVAMSYLISFCLCYLIINVVNNRESIITKWGDNSLTIFLFHPFFVFALIKIQSLVNINSVILFIALILMSLCITILLSATWFVKLTNFLCSPYSLIKNIRIKLFKSKMA